MKLLRQIVRLILENQAHYQKIASIMMRETVEDVNQSITLAETLGYVSNVQHTIDEPDWEGTRYRWSFDADPNLYQEIKRQKDTVLHKKRACFFS